MRSPKPTKDPSSAILAALNFAAQKHSRQRRKDSEASPYINHPIAVAEVLSRIGGITDVLTLQSAILHDTIEDTETTPKELQENFGEKVRLIVQELTDNKSLPKQERKRLQAEHAPNLSAPAKLIKRESGRFGESIRKAVAETQASRVAPLPVLTKGLPGNVRLIRVDGGKFYSGGCHPQIKVP